MLLGFFILEIYRPSLCPKIESAPAKKVRPATVRTNLAECVTYVGVGTAAPAKRTVSVGRNGIRAGDAAKIPLKTW